MSKLIGLFLCCMAIASGAWGQKIKIDHSDKNLTFTGTEAIQNDAEYDSTGQLVLNGYISSYYAFYNDSVGHNDFVQLPTVAPYSNKFGLNIVQLGGVYTSDRFRGNFTFHWGDIPQSAWSAKYNFIQEANAGVRIMPRLWFDMGLFRTHIGLESIQPRENIASSIATTTYFEPYFLSGAKLTYRVSKKLALQANVFNSFNTFIETNRDKAIGLSAVITPNDRLSVTINTITCDESPDDFTRNQRRWYNNAYLIYRSEKFDLGAEYNFGMQQNTNLSDSTKMAYMNSALLALKYRLGKRVAIYAREEFFSDPDEILTGPIENSHHDLIGLDFVGETLGIEVKPIKNSYFRLEARTLRTKPNEDIFRIAHKATNHREEFMLTMGVWF
ncbi:MAG: hypothetical protein EP338_01590 [Bacteroidetes bacterium]|nr:MAG: hypothetical protein EP338_01590 [Bacteroidota bacterium]